MAEEFIPQKSWYAKFANAFCGISLAIRDGSSFVVHCLAAVAVIVAAVIFRLNRIEWCLLLLCIGVVISAELFNSSIEKMAKAIDRTKNSQLGESLDIASGAVLITAITAATVGLIIFVAQLI